MDPDSPARGIHQKSTTAVGNGLFNDGAESFLLSHRTTLAELAEFVDELGSRHDGVPIAG